MRRQPLLQQVEGRIGARLLEYAERYIEQKQGCNHRCFDPFTDQSLQGNRSLKHPRHRRPEMAEHADDGIHLLFGDFIGAELGQPAGGFY